MNVRRIPPHMHKSLYSSLQFHQTLKKNKYAFLCPFCHLFIYLLNVRQLILKISDNSTKN